MCVAATNVNYHMIWVTACFGAYVFIISFSLFYGRYPVDLNIAQLYMLGAVKSVENNFYLYMGVWLLMSTLGVACQCYSLWYFKKTGKEF